MKREINLGNGFLGSHGTNGIIEGIVLRARGPLIMMVLLHFVLNQGLLRSGEEDVAGRDRRARSGGGFEGVDEGRIAKTRAVRAVE